MIDAIDRVARTSADHLRATTSGDVEAGLADLHVRQARHRRRTQLGAAAALVLAVSLGVGAGSLISRSDDARPAPTQRPTPVPGSEDATCTSPLVTCLGDRTYGFALERPVVWALPPGFGADSGGGASSVQVESYRTVGPTAGVTVLEHVRAATPDGLRVAPGVVDSPRAFVTWVAHRPFLDAGQVTRTTLDGRPAWRVRVVLDPAAGRGATICNRFRCHAVTVQPGGGPTGVWGNMAAQYIALRLPGGGTTVVWSWIFTGNPAHLGTLEEAVHGISWPAG